MSRIRRILRGLLLTIYWIVFGYFGVEFILSSFRSDNWFYDFIWPWIIGIGSFFIGFIIHHLINWILINSQNEISS